jgi:enamine deaminase RidA (YjgF/YER057c/UK114 family)
MAPEERLTELGIVLPDAPAVMGAYVPVTVRKGFAFVAGHPPMRDGKIVYQGHVGEAVSLDDGYQAARLCTLNALSSLKAALGNLDRVDAILSLRGFVSCGAGFADQPSVVDGASDLLVEIFGDAGRHARAAVGAPALPSDISVEIEMVIALSD